MHPRPGWVDVDFLRDLTHFLVTALVAGKMVYVVSCANDGVTDALDKGGCELVVNFGKFREGLAILGNVVASGLRDARLIRGVLRVSDAIK